MPENKSFPIDIKHVQVVAFAKAMDDVLTQNDYKGGWQDCRIQYLQARLIEELGEYFASVAVGASGGDLATKELVDIANFAMMLWDRETYRCLH